MRRIHPEQSQNGDSREPAVFTAPKKPRSKIACDTCRRRKLRCNGESTCGQCQASNQSCTFSRPNKPQSTSSQQDNVARSTSLTAPRDSTQEMEMVMDDPTEITAPESPPGANLSDGNRWLSLNPQPPTPGLIQTNQRASMGSRTSNEEPLTSDLNQLRPPGDWFDGQGGMTLGQAETFQSTNSCLGNIGGLDSLWPLDDFVSRTPYLADSQIGYSHSPGHKLLA